MHLNKHVRKRKDGRFEFDRVINGQRFYKMSRNYKEVNAFASEVSKQIKNAINLEDPNKVKFNDYAREFYTTFRKKKIRERSQDEWEHTLKLFDKHFNISFRRISAMRFQNFINEIEEDAPVTALKMYHKITAICRKAFALQIITMNIADIIEKPSVENKTRRALTYEEQQIFLEKLSKCDQDIKVFCLFCIITSARRNEAIRLKPTDLNERKLTLFINGTKTLNAPRTIKITQEFADLIKTIGCKFPHTSDYYSRKAKEIFIEMGSPDLVCNSFRHTCATNMVYLKISPDFRKSVMGHSTIVVTDRVYTHMELGISKEMIEELYPHLYFTDY